MTVTALNSGVFSSTLTVSKFGATGSSDTSTALETTTSTATITNVIETTAVVSSPRTFFLSITPIFNVDTEMQAVDATIAVIKKRQIATNIPTYASACGGFIRYSSACACLGVTAPTSTVATTTVTTTTTVPVTVISTTVGVVTATGSAATGSTVLTTSTVTENKLVATAVTSTETTSVTATTEIGVTSTKLVEETTLLTSTVTSSATLTTFVTPTTSLPPVVESTTTTSVSSTENISSSTTSTSSTASPTASDVFARNFCLRVTSPSILQGAKLIVGPNRFNLRGELDPTPAALFDINLTTGQVFQNNDAVALSAPFEADTRPLNSFTPSQVQSIRLAPLICRTSGSSLPIGVPLDCIASGNDGSSTNSYTRFFYNSNDVEGIVRMATASRVFNRVNTELTLAPYAGSECVQTQR